METAILIERLAADVERVRPHAVPKRVLLGLALGALASALLLLSAMGLRSDLVAALQSGFFWLKGAYALSLALVASAMVIELARPGGAASKQSWLILPILGLAGASLGQLLYAPQDMWLALLLGKSWLVCPLRILALAAPIFVALLWSFRRLAPTDLRSAGAAAGLLSGAMAAVIYCLSCPETSAIFLLAWYNLGIGLAGALGALLGPKFLRW
jgi:hypothetical protein